jgi:hypothetical protein
MIAIILFIVAAVLFGLVALNVPQTKLNWTGAGLFCLTLAFLAGRF